MLTLTENAVRAIRSLTDDQSEPGESGLRIMSGGNQTSTLQLSLSPSPMAGDKVLEADGARVFIEPAAAEVLSDKSLDAEVDNDGGVAFSVGQQEA